MDGTMHSVQRRCRPCWQFARLGVRIRPRSDVHCLIGRRFFGWSRLGRSDALRLNSAGGGQAAGERGGELFQLRLSLQQRGKFLFHLLLLLVESPANAIDLFAQ